MDSIDGWYDFLEGDEENRSNISEYNIARIKDKIRSLRHSYYLVILYPGFVNYKYKTWTECCDEAVTYFYSNFKGWEYLKSGITIHNWNKEFKKGGYSLGTRNKK